MANYVNDILPLEEEGKTDAEIVAFLAPKTLKGIRCSDIKILLEESGLVIEDPITRVRSGSLIAFYQGMPDNQNKQLLGWFIGHVFGRGEEVSSHTQPRASQIVDTIASLPGELQPVGAALVALGGGQPWVDLTEAEIATLRQEYADQQARIEAVGQVNSKAGIAMTAAQAAMDQGETPANILAAAESAWSNA